MKLLKHKIFFYLLFPIVVVTLSYFLVTNFFLNRIYYGYIENNSKLIAEKIAQSLKEQLLTGNIVSITSRIFEEKNSGLSIKYIVVFDNETRMIAHTHLGEMVEKDHIMHLDNKKMQGLGYINYEGRRVFNVDVPVQAGLNTIGIVRVGYDFTEMQKGFITVLYMYITLLILTMLLVLFLSARLSRLIIKPIENLTVAVSKFSENNYGDVIEVKTSDEIGKLSLAFNEMVRGIRHWREMLETEKKKTEEKIHELEEWQQTTIGRELKMIELKKEVEFYKSELVSKNKGVKKSK